jgi:DNA repair protein RecN (Recombination protein N)
MLKRLKVDNLAIVEHAEAEFGEGLTVITGETGAGKSVFMGALTLALGARADASAVRDGCREARIEAEFDGEGVASFLEGQGMPACEDGALLVRRVISASGGSRVWINDSAASVQTLRALGDLLVDIHGPNDRRSLVDEDFQRDTLDRYGKIDISAYTALWRTLVGLKERRAELEGTVDVADEMERLRSSIEEIDAAHLTDDDEDALTARHAAAAHAAEIVEAANAATAALTGEGGDPYGGDGAASAADLLVSAGGSFREMAKYHEVAGEWMDELDRIITSVQELSRTVEDSVSRIDADPDALQALDDRISLVRRLKRKYACGTVAELLALRERRGVKLADLEDRDEKIRELDVQIVAAGKAVEKAGERLSAARRKAGVRLGSAVTGELRGLGFLKAGFSVAFEPHEPDATGCDRVIYRFEPNPGESSRPLAQIASTGEIARVMLAVKAVIAEHDAIPVLVFDEIDSNIGGETGRAVGERLRAVARHHQVIAITHLAQSAVYGDRHFAVSKTVSGGRTRSAIQEIAGEERVAEIARMLGGARLTSVVEQHARELLELANAKESR